MDVYVWVVLLLTALAIIIILAKRAGKVSDASVGSDEPVHEADVYTPPAEKPKSGGGVIVHPGDGGSAPGPEAPKKPPKSVETQDVEVFALDSGLLPGMWICPFCGTENASADGQCQVCKRKK